MAWAVALVMKCDAITTPSGAYPAPSLSPPQTSALQTSHCPTTMVAGVTLLFSTSIWQNLLSCILLNTVLELCLFPSEGMGKNAKNKKWVSTSVIQKWSFQSSSFNSLSFFLCVWQSALFEERRHKIHHQRPLLLQPGFDHQRRRCRGCPCSVNQRVENRLANHVKELGTKLAEQLVSQWPGLVFPSHGQWW